MSPRYYRAYFVTLCSLVLCTMARLLAEETEENKARELSPNEEMAIHTQRLSEMPEEVQMCFQSSPKGFVKKGLLDDIPYLYRIHPYAYYHPVATSASGDNIQLHDGSLWYVHPYQKNRVRYWVQSENIFIKPNAACFSMYKYVLQNRDTQEVIEVNYLGDQAFPGMYTHWIVEIDFFNKKVYLNDNTVWQIRSSEYAFNKWRVQDRLIIGVNNRWRHAAYPHILINTSMTGAPYCEADISY